MNWVFLDITFDLNQQKDDYANLISSGFTGINNDLTPKDDNALPYSLKLAEGDNNQPSNRNIVLFWYTVKVFVVTPLMTKNSIFFKGGYDKGYKLFIADENLFVCILIYFNKNIHFHWIIKKFKNYKIKFSSNCKLY